MKGNTTLPKKCSGLKKGIKTGLELTQRQTSEPKQGQPKTPVTRCKEIVNKKTPPPPGPEQNRHKLKIQAKWAMSSSNDRKEEENKNQKTNAKGSTQCRAQKKSPQNTSAESKTGQHQ